jgi:hypothetical protein
MKEYTALLSYTTLQTVRHTVEAANDEEAAVVFSALVQDLNGGKDNPDVKDNLELDSDEWDWDDLECVTNCDEDEEDKEEE